MAANRFLIEDVMKKLGLILAGLFAALLFAYGSISALVNQGLGLRAAVLIFGAIVVGGVGIVMFVGKNPDPPRDPES